MNKTMWSNSLAATIATALVWSGCSPVAPSGGGDGASGGSSAVGSGGTASGGAGAGGTSASGGAPIASGGAPPSGGQASTGGDASGSGGAVPASGGTSGDTGIVVPVGATPDERHLLLRDEGNSQLHYVDLGVPTNTWHVAVPAGREVQLVGSNKILVGTENGYEERSAVDGSLVATEDSFPGTLTARRLRNGNTLLSGVDWQGETGVVLLEINAAGEEQDRIVYSDFTYARLVRETPTGTFLVTSDVTIFEGDRDGNVVWQVGVQDSTEAHAWKALRLASGETVVATGYEASLQRFSAEEAFLGRIQAPSEASPLFFSDFQLLPGGNYLVANWQDHGPGHGAMGLQVIELNPSGTLVWSWQQDPTFVSSIQGVILLDGLDLGKLHVEDTTGELVPVD
jgi:hypothetical protein